MDHRFDLIEQPWIGVRRLDGTLVRVGIADALALAHEFQGDLHGHTPTATAALWRILAVLTYRVTGLDDPQIPAVEWNRKRAAAQESGRLDAAPVSDYLERHRDKFDLFNRSRPWLQDPRLDPDDTTRGGQGDKWSGLNRLLPGRPSDNSPAVWSLTPATDPHPVDVLTAVDGLLHTLWYGAGGQVGKRWSGVYGSTGRVGSNNAQPGPLRGRVSTHPTGRTLFDSLLAHLVPTAGYRHPSAAGPDEAPWETERLPGPSTATGTCATGIVGQLTAHRHAALLRPGPGDGQVDEAVVTPLHLDKAYPDTVALDPYLPWRWREPKDREPFRAPLEGDVGRAVWRDLDAILATPDSTQAGSAAVLTTGHAEGITVIVADQERAQSRDLGWAVSRLPADLAAADPTARALVSSALQAADLAAAELKGSVTRLTKPQNNGSTPPDKGLADTGLTWASAEAAYWMQAEEAFTERLVQILDASVSPGKLFADTALQVFDGLTDRLDRLEHLPRLVEERDRLSRNLRRKSAPIAEEKQGGSR